MKKVLKFSILAIFAILIPLFQNCTQSVSNSAVLNAQGNGGSYDGMAARLFSYFSVTQPCANLDLKGNPLPNEEIVFKSGTDGIVAPYLSRQACQDIPPVVIPASQLIVNSPTSISYNNNLFSPFILPGAFDLAMASCPAGKTPISGAVMTNEFSSPLDWTVQQPWNIYAGIGVGIFGTIDSLPAYSIQRNNASELDEWRRVSQVLSIHASTDYAFTFFAQPGTVQAADWIFFRNVSGSAGVSTNPLNETGLVTFNFQTVTATVQYFYNITHVSAVITPFANGFLCTVYFTSTATDNQAPTIDMGVTPSAPSGGSGNLGDSIIATDAQLVQINEFCQ